MKTKSYLKEIKTEFPRSLIKENGNKYLVASSTSNFSYFIDVDNKVVVAKLTEYWDADILNLLTSYEILTKDYSSQLYKQALEIATTTEWEYRGKAKCHEDDKFNLRYGIALARNRALREYNKKELKRTIILRKLLARMDQALSKKQLNIADGLERHAALPTLLV